MFLNDDNLSESEHIREFLDFPVDVQAQSFIKAAVLVPFFEEAGELKLILTKRSTQVRHHKGQICFPGGAHDPTDESLWATALREFEEELGVASAQIQYVSELAPVRTPTYFEVKPFIGFLPSDFEIKPNADEVESVLVIPAQHFRDDTQLRFEEREYFGRTFQVPFYSYESHDIWGVTGRILHKCMKLWK